MKGMGIESFQKSLSLKLSLSVQDKNHITLNSNSHKYCRLGNSVVYSSSPVAGDLTNKSKWSIQIKMGDISIFDPEKSVSQGHDYTGAGLSCTSVKVLLQKLCNFLQDTEMCPHSEGLRENSSLTW